MSIVGGFFNAKNVNGLYDRVYNAEDFAAYFANFISSGVFAQPSNQMKVVPGGGLSVDVSVGKGYIKGYWVDVPQTHHLTVSPNMAGQTEQIKVVCKIDFGNRVPVLEVQENVESLLPENDYELVLATFSLQVGESEITAAMITDRRPDDAYCGFVTGLVDQIDFTELMSQQKAQFNEWFDAMKGQLSEDAAGNLQIQIDALSEAMPEDLSDLTNKGSDGKYNDIYIKRGYRQGTSSRPSNYGPDKLYRCDSSEAGVAPSCSSRYRSLSTGGNTSRDGCGWEYDWRLFWNEEIRYRDLETNYEYYLTNSDYLMPTLIFLSFHVEGKTNFKNLGESLHCIPMGCIASSLEKWPDDASAGDKIQDNRYYSVRGFIASHNSPYAKVCDYDVVFHFVRRRESYAGGDIIEIIYYIVFDRISVTWASGYSSNTDTLNMEIFCVGAGVYDKDVMNRDPIES